MVERWWDAAGDDGHETGRESSQDDTDSRVGSAAWADSATRAASGKGEGRGDGHLFEMKVHAELLRRDLEKSGVGHPAWLGARARFYLLDDDSALTALTKRLEGYRRRHLN